jgi:site-specific DNA-adenine methylase
LTVAADMKFTRLVNYYGSDVEVRELIASQINEFTPSLVVIPFVGSFSIVPLLDAKKIVCNDLHRHVTNLASVMREPKSGPRLYRTLKRMTFDPDRLFAAQAGCKQRDAFVNDADGLYAVSGRDHRFDNDDRFDWAVDYFICSWMTRGGDSGTTKEFSGKLAVRYSPNGGGSGQRFHNAVTSIPAWRRALRKCEITNEDAFDVLAAAHDSPRCALYVDAPWPDAGEKYRHRFTDTQQRKLARELTRFKQARVVIRYGDHPLIRELYPESNWRWLIQPGRNQQNNDVDEVVIVGGAGGAD